MSEMVEISRTSALELQSQLDEYKEKNRREFVDLQRQLKEKNIEVEKSRLMNIRMQDEVMTQIQWEILNFDLEFSAGSFQDNECWLSCICVISCISWEAFEFEFHGGDQHVISAGEMRVPL